MIQTRTIDLGPVAVVPKGNWDANYDYELLNMVQYDHDSWISLAMHNRGNAPAAGSAYWFRSTDGGKYAYEQGQAAAASTTEADNVDVEIAGMTVTVTNRHGQSTSVNIGFEIYNTYSSVAAMEADAPNVPTGKFVMIATEDPTSPENARLYGKNSQGSFTFLSDLDQASSSAWADWLNNMKPLIETAIAQASSDHTRSEADHSTASSDHSTAVADHQTASADHSVAVSDHTQALSDTQTASDDHAASVQATANANEKAALANEKATLANQKASLADEKATLADTKAGLANDAAELANTKAGLADDAATLANTKAALADEKAGLADEKATLANTKAVYAGEQGDYAKNMAEHPAYIADGTTGDLNYWYVWDYTTQQYVRSAYAKGDDLDWSTITQEEMERLIDSIKEDLVVASVSEAVQAVSELT